jgi:hypothetical protein
LSTESVWVPWLRERGTSCRGDKVSVVRSPLPEAIDSREGVEVGGPGASLSGWEGEYKPNKDDWEVGEEEKLDQEGVCDCARGETTWALREGDAGTSGVCGWTCWEGFGQAGAGGASSCRSKAGTGWRVAATGGEIVVGEA